MLSAEGVLDREEAIYIFADASRVSTNEIGVHPIGVTVASWHREFGIAPDDSELLTIDVYDPAMPYYNTVGFLPRYGWYAHYLFRGDDLSGLTLWRSDDEGESWYDYTAEAIIAVNPDTDIKLYFQEPPDYPILLVWEAEGIGETKILRITWDIDYV